MEDGRGSGHVPGRRVIRRAERKFLDYDLEGPPQPEMEWLPISYDRRTGQGCYLMRMAPGAVTIPHNHPGMEEFLIIEGELTDPTARSFVRATSSATKGEPGTIPGPGRAVSSLYSNGSVPAGPTLPPNGGFGAEPGKGPG